MPQRETSIDVLRGLAITGMVLSGTISRNENLPAWLFHAQIPPPDFIFDPTLAGITWVDLVFPFFLFAMGMSFPFSMGRDPDKKIPYRKMTGKIVLRALKLLFFAIMLGHLSPFHYPPDSGATPYLMGLAAFTGFFLAFSRFPLWQNRENLINLAGYLFIIILVLFRVYGLGLEFSIHRNDIIILVLANMALFGGFIWLFTRHNWHMRLGILALYFVLRLTHSTDDSWNRILWDFTPFKWLASSFQGLGEFMATIGIDLHRTIFYNPEYLKYLMIVIPGSIAGDILRKGFKEKATLLKDKREWVLSLLPFILTANIALNLWGLLSRNIDFVWIMNLATLGFIAYLANKTRIRQLHNFRNLLLWSSFWLLLGLVFEAWQGGIKKDHATLSYFFLTSGLAGFSIATFILWEPLFIKSKLLQSIAFTGINPMPAYIAAVYLFIPLLWFVGLLNWIDSWHTYWHWAGLFRGLMLTSLVILFTVITVKHKYFWKT